jgi:hypothetical protein
VDPEEEHIFEMNFQYPIKFDPDTVSEFMNIAKDLEMNETFYRVDYRTNLILLTYGYVHSLFDYGFEIGKGYWIKK